MSLQANLLNCFVQVFNFFVVSAVAFGISRLLAAKHVLDQALADGMLICSCMPMAINVVIILTAKSGGDDAAAVFNSTFGNVIVAIRTSHVFFRQSVGLLASQEGYSGGSWGQEPYRRIGVYVGLKNISLGSLLEYVSQWKAREVPMGSA